MLDRQVAPPVQPLASVTLPAADVLSLPNGARLHVLRNDAQPVVRLQIVFKAGRWYEPAPSVALLTARMLLEGTRTRTARQIADEVAFYGASLDCEHGFDRATVTLYCLTRHLDALLPLVLDVVTEPIFPDAELQLLKTRTLQNVRIERQKTSYLASEQFGQSVYGPDFPYGVIFDEQRFQAVTAEAVRSFHGQAFALGSAEIFLCGDISSQHEQSIVAMLGTGAATDSAHALPHNGQPVSGTSHAFVLQPESLQSSIRIGRLWPQPGTVEGHSLQVLVKVLGGYFGSRLMKNIREDKGFTYGIYASISPREHATNLVIGTDVNAASTQAAIREIHYELRRLQEERIPADELQTVKNYMTGKFANELSTVFEQCDKYKSLVFLNLPLTYYTDFLQQVRDTDAAYLQSLAQQYLSPDSMLEVVAGPRV
ncbi:insulinase family protein [Hymenobacter sp. BT175]|uniref:M16 family metallopeptidase n=1 Tax=Hymenobacter translucens TaxID=2886507 RepID=UPI001D0E08EF|nr:pitrilysin family protein [Hymenobacter translucens]MCC2547492.1 insulinase family protein [Hymenobacter translucens]